MIPRYGAMVYSPAQERDGPTAIRTQDRSVSHRNEENYEPSALTWLSYGPANAANRARTCDIMVNSHALYQLSYSGLHNNHGSAT